MRASDCALLVAVPLDRAAFLAGLASGSDFGRLFAESRRTRDPDILWHLYQPSALSVVRTIARADRRGVTVVDRATAADFAQCVAASPVVTLVAHWLTARFRPSDILDTVGVRRRLGDTDVASDHVMKAETIAAMLNDRLESTRCGEFEIERNDSAAAAAETWRQYRLWRRRKVFEEVLGASVRAGGPAIEFADRIVPVERVAATVPESFTRVLDLTICHSLVLAEEIRRRCRGGLILATAFAATLDIRMQFYERTLDLVERRHLTYQDASFVVRRDVRRAS